MGMELCKAASGTVAVIDYGCGNLFSLCRSLEYIGARCVLTGDAAQIRRCERIILPGVGAFGLAAQKLRAGGLDEIIRAEAVAGKPLLGICVGMQLLLERSCEFGTHEGLGLIAGEVVPIAGLVPEGYKIPHMGWNHLRFPAERAPLFAAVEEGTYVYFVHSYCAARCAAAALTDYGALLTAAVAQGNVMGVQFHPEKSGRAGLEILRTFCGL